MFLWSFPAIKICLAQEQGHTKTPPLSLFLPPLPSLPPCLPHLQKYVMYGLLFSCWSLCYTWQRQADV